MTRWLLCESLVFSYFDYTNRDFFRFLLEFLFLFSSRLSDHVFDRQFLAHYTLSVLIHYTVTLKYGVFVRQFICLSQ